MSVPDPTTERDDRFSSAGATPRPWSEIGSGLEHRWAKGTGGPATVWLTGGPGRRRPDTIGRNRPRSPPGTFDEGLLIVPVVGWLRVGAAWSPAQEHAVHGLGERLVGLDALHAYPADTLGGDRAG